MEKKYKKLYYNSIKKPVWIREREHRRGIRTPTTYRYGKSWEGSSGDNMELLKLLYNRGINPSMLDYEKGGKQFGLIIV